jgi:ribose 5-phosphate isomerase A
MASLKPFTSTSWLHDADRRAVRPDRPGGGMSDRDTFKRAAAARAVEEVEDGMVVGLGSGSTAEIALDLLAARQLRIVGVPTSERTAQLAQACGIALAGLDTHPALDLAIDGADQVERGTLDLIKGLGGALLREKIVAAAARRLIIMVDDSKLVDRLGGHTALPVEIVAFGWRSTVDRLARAGLHPAVRGGAERPFVTDGGNLIADCAVGPIDDAGALEARLRTLVGVIESGLFLGLASRVIVAGANGVEVLDRCAR